MYSIVYIVCCWNLLRVFIIADVIDLAFAPSSSAGRLDVYRTDASLGYWALYHDRCTLKMHCIVQCCFTVLSCIGLLCVWYVKCRSYRCASPTGCPFVVVSRLLFYRNCAPYYCIYCIYCIYVICCIYLYVLSITVCPPFCFVCHFWYLEDFHVKLFVSATGAQTAPFQYPGGLVNAPPPFECCS